MAYATADDVTVRWGRSPSREEAALIEVRLEDVERMIRRRIPKLHVMVDEGFLDLDDVKQVEAEAVLRLVRNPEGYLSETDGNYTYMLQKDLSNGKLTITDDEWAILGAVRKSLFSIVPVFLLGDGTSTSVPVDPILSRRGWLK